MECAVTNSTDSCPVGCLRSDDSTHEGRMPSESDRLKLGLVQGRVRPERYQGWRSFLAQPLANRWHSFGMLGTAPCGVTTG